MNKLYRSRTNRWVTGLCGGLAEYFGINATLLRLVVIIISLGSFGTAALLYFIATLFIPKGGSTYPM